jgi:hypothetical protein
MNSQSPTDKAVLKSEPLLSQSNIGVFLGQDVCQVERCFLSLLPFPLVTLGANEAEVQVFS